MPRQGQMERWVVPDMSFQILRNACRFLIPSSSLFVYILHTTTKQLYSTKLFTLFGSNHDMCTLEKRGCLFILTLTGDNEHWISPNFISSFLSLLAQLKSQATRGSVLLTTSHGRFFSNGFDLPWAQTAASKSAARDRIVHMVHIFKPIVAALLSLPMPTIAAVSGHAAAAGFALALCHDYFLMRRDKGVLYMSEVSCSLFAFLESNFLILFSIYINLRVIQF